MKKTKLIILGVLAILIGIPTVNAATASINVKTNNKTVIVGSTTKVTVTVSSSDLGAWEYCISYDSSILKLTNSTADANTCVKAGYVEKKGQTSSSETFTFKAIKSGTSKVTVKSYAIYSYETEGIMQSNASSVTIKTMTQAELESTYSTNANLKSISVDNYELTPAFNKNTLEYNVEVPNEITSVNLSALKEDANAQVSGSGVKELTEGDNKFEIVVTAQKGNSKTYKVNIYRKELDPIAVTIDGKEYFIVRKADALPQYPTFTATTIPYEEYEIPALHSEITDYTIIGVKDDDANISMYIYKDGTFTRYEEIKSDALTIFPKSLPDDAKFNSLKKVSVDYNGYKLDGYQVEDKSNFAIIYAQNIETGDVKYYSLDKKNGTIQEYNDEMNEHYNSIINVMKYIILGFIIITIILLLILIFRRPRKKNQKYDGIFVQDDKTLDTEVNQKIKETQDKQKDRIYEINSKQNIQDNTLENTLSKKELKKLKKKHKDEKAG